VEILRGKRDEMQSLVHAGNASPMAPGEG
jgi:hypothetical protein